MAVAVLGHHRIMLGTDYPIFDTATAVEALETASIAEPCARVAIARTNAERDPAPRPGLVSGVMIEISLDRLT